MQFPFPSGFPPAPAPAPAPVAIASHRAAANEMQLNYLHCIFVSWLTSQGVFRVCGVCGRGFGFGLGLGLKVC